MDREDDFIKNKAIVEDENFNLPKSFEDKIELVLKNIEYEENNNSWYRNKKFLVLAASFVISCFVLIRLANKNHLAFMSADGAPKSSAIMESAKDEAFEILSEEAEVLREDQLYSGAEPKIANITLTLNFNKNEVRGIQGQVIYDNSYSSDNKILKSQIVESIQTLEVSKGGTIDMNFSETPNSYRVNLLKKGLNQDQIEVEEYSSENLILQAPSETGVYIFEVIGRWDDREIKYTVKIQVNDN